MHYLNRHDSSAGQCLTHTCIMRWNPL